MLRTTLAILLGATYAAACSSGSESAPPPKAAVSPVAVPSQTSAPNSQNSTPASVINCNTPSPSPTLSGSSSSNMGLNLLNSITYESRIQSLISAKCLSCHTNPSDTREQPKLTSWPEVQSVAARIISTSGSDKVISTGHSNRFSLTTQEKADFQSWAQAGYPLNAATSSPSPSPSNTSSIDCNNNSSVPGGETLKNPKKLTECNNQGLVYDFVANKDVAPDAQTCTTFKLGSWCNLDGIVREFGSSGNAARNEINRLTNQGYNINQCGEDGANRFVYLIKEEVVNGTNVLRVHKLRPQ